MRPYAPASRFLFCYTRDKSNLTALWAGCMIREGHSYESPILLHCPCRYRIKYRVTNLNPPILNGISYNSSSRRIKVPMTRPHHVSQSPAPAPPAISFPPTKTEIFNGNGDVTPAWTIGGTHSRPRSEDVLVSIIRNIWVSDWGAVDWSNLRSMWVSLKS
jgi:hypothetical protein